MHHLANTNFSLKKSFSHASKVNYKKFYRRSIRACLIAILIAAPMVAPRKQVAQDLCAKKINEGCFEQASRDIAFMLDASGSIEQRGQTYNVEIEGVLRAINDSTIIPRDGTVAVSVIVFNESANIAVPLTEINGEDDAKKIADVVESLKCASIHSQRPPCPFGATRYAGAIRAADINLSQERNGKPKPGVRRVFLMSTDGEPSDLDAAIQQVEQARIASTLSIIPFEMDVILVGLDSQSQEFDSSKSVADQIVTPKPTSDLPGATFAIKAGECNREGAAPDSADCNRQANEFAELTRNIIRGNVPTLRVAVRSGDDTAPDTPAAANEPLSLRQAIEQANCNGGSASIVFDSSLKGKTIHLTSPLPPMTTPDTVIDGCGGDSCAPSITLDGGGQVSDGLIIRTNRNVIRGLKLINFTRAAITIGAGCRKDTVGHNRIEQNTIENTPTGILVLGDRSNERNTISRNNISRPAPAPGTPSTALIDLGGDGPTANDAGDEDAGPNTLLNFPDSMTVTATGDKVTVTGQLNSPPAGGATVEIFAVTRFRLDENRILIDAVTFLTQATADKAGNFRAADLAPSPTGIYTATVTDRPAFDNERDSTSNTSELMFDSTNTPLPRPKANVTNDQFGEVTLNAPKTVPVIINNTGSAPLSIKGCSIGRCPETDSDNRDRFVVSDCPTSPINPGQAVTMNVIFTPNACGLSRACLFLQSDDPQRPQIVIELTGTGIASPRAVIQGGVTLLKFKRVAARGTPRSNPQTLTFTIMNPGCSALILQSARLARGGLTDDSGTFTVAPQSAQTTFPLTVGAGNSVTFAVSFNPVIPKVGGSQPRVKDLLPSEITDTLIIQPSGGEQVTLTLQGSVKKGVKLINPSDPAAAPLVTICKSGNDFIVEFSAWDSNRNVTRAAFVFRDNAGRPVGATITVENLDQILREQGIQRGQSFTITQRFSGANDNRQVASVEVTIFDGEGSDTADSGSIGSACSASARLLRQIDVS